MDFATRDQYRHAVEDSAKRTGVEVAIAAEAIKKALGSSAIPRSDCRTHHVGFHLIRKQRHLLRRVRILARSRQSPLQCFCCGRPISRNEFRLRRSAFSPHFARFNPESAS